MTGLGIHLNQSHFECRSHDETNLWKALYAAIYGEQIVSIMSVGLSVKLEIRSSRTEIRLDMIGVLLAKPTAQNFETCRLNSTPTAKSRKRKVCSGR